VRALALLWLAAATAAPAQTVALSRGPDHVEITVYRNPQRAPAEAPDLDWLNGYALISETRRITLPAGESEIRFEGVAGGIIPQSAIVTGLPEGLIERNRDAYLLSPESLVDRSLGRRVHLRRTSRATGAVTETEAVIRTGAGGALVVQTAAGFEALRCTGLPETLVYDGVPPGLSARPTLSLRARSAQAVTANVTLSYLASGFDWQANYIARLAPDGRHVELFAWLTLASMDETSFIAADTQAVAGNLHREDVEVEPPEGGALELHCWPQASTSDIPLEQWQRMASGVVNFGGDDANIVVTGSRVRQPNLEATAPVTVINARQEELGDLKLYRIPEPVTLAARSQKQVALMTRPNVSARFVYRQRFDLGTVIYSGEQEVPHRFLITRNRASEGLGLPLPAGGMVLFGGDPARPIVLGQGSLPDRAVGEDVEADLGPSIGMLTNLCRAHYADGAADYVLTVTNDGAQPAAFEAELAFADVSARASLGTRVQSRLWAVSVPANGRLRLEFRAGTPANFGAAQTQPIGTCPAQ
jgi:hypothetical protein